MVALCVEKRGRPTALRLSRAADCCVEARFCGLEARQTKVEEGRIRDIISSAEDRWSWYVPMSRYGQGVVEIRLYLL